MVGRRFIDAFNRRDAEALIALADPMIDFRPTRSSERNEPTWVTMACVNGSQT